MNVLRRVDPPSLHWVLLAALLVGGHFASLGCSAAHNAADAGSAADGGPADAGPGDSGVADSGPTDSGAADSGPPDAGVPDSGPTDSGPTDAGVPDSGPLDAGPMDAGPAPFDGGPALSQLPIGDHEYGTSPQVGTVDSCQTTFGGIGGASKAGPWLDYDAGTWDYYGKIAVEGMVAWPSHSLSIKVSGSTRDVMTNGLPDHDTGVFPISSSDPAYAYDQNPNSIQTQSVVWSLPQTPTVNATPTCLGGGPIGVMLSGAMLYDALDGEGRDAVANEVQDACQGHPDPSGTYHYHWVSTCLDDTGTGHSALLGYARDGFGIYGPRGEDGGVLTDADLDECHGHTHAISWDGTTTVLYHYHATWEFPYTVGCYRGTPQ